MKQGEPAWLVALGAAAAVALGAAAALARLEVLSAWPEPVGVDGYWYAVQVRSLLEDGHTYYPALPAALWLLCPTGAALGPIVGIKVGAAIAVSAHALAAFALGRVLAKSTAAGVIAAAVVATSPASIYLTTEFVKQGIALALLAGFLAALLYASERPGRGRIGLALLTGAAAALSHKLAFAVGLAATGAVVFAGWRAGGRRWTVALALVGAAAALFLLVTWRRWIGVLSASPDFALPALRYPSGVALRFGHETAAAALVALALLAIQLASSRRGTGDGPLDRSPVGWTLVVLALFTAVPWLAVSDPDGIGFRLRLSAHLALAPLAGLLLAHAVRDKAPAFAAASAVAVAVALLAIRPLAREEGVVRPNPAMVAAAHRAAAALPPDAEIVAPDRQVAFLMTWATRRPARTRPRSGDLGPATWRALPGGWLDSAAAHALSQLAIDTHPSQTGGFYLVPEAAYRAMLSRLSPADRLRWDNWDRSGWLSPPRRNRYDGFFGEERTR